MDFGNRNRRLKEFGLWFEFKYGTPNPVKTEGVQRIIDQTLHLQNLIKIHHPKCYWCRRQIEIMDIEVDEDKLTIHHIDEDRTHNTIENLDLCHKTCHQTMHKLSQSSGIPAMVLWAAANGTAVASGVKLGIEIPGIGRGV